MTDSRGIIWAVTSILDRDLFALCCVRSSVVRSLPPLPDKLTPHSLRRTFCSLLYALGEDPGVVMDEMGHADPGLALRVYRQAMRRGEEEKAKLSAVVDGALKHDR
ncbi:MAG: hypothetical protein WB709_11635 [Solirubrobacteraceae bacterium]